MKCAIISARITRARAMAEGRGQTVGDIGRAFDPNVNADQAMAQEHELRRQLVGEVKTAIVTNAIGATVASRANLLQGQGGKKGWGWQHIYERHWYNTSATNVSKFARNFSLTDLRTAINGINLANPTRVEGTQKVFEIAMGRVIGTTQGGAASTMLRIVTDSAGKVISAYPI